MKRRAIVLFAAAVAASGSALALKPRRRAAKDLQPVMLETQVPASFAGWSIDKSLIPVLPDPSLQAALNQIYGQVLARTYINGKGQRVMLSIAYGEDQGTDATAAHRPEFCYTAQGFSVAPLGEETLRIGNQSVRTRRLQADMQTRHEPITYWVTLNQRAVLPGVSRKLEQIRLGLLGQVPDGMLVRVSSISNSRVEAFQSQDDFLNSLYKTMTPEVRARYFGSVES